MLTRFRAENFKALASIDVALERFTVLVGPNGCGKSSVLEGIERLGQPIQTLKSGITRELVELIKEQTFFTGTDGVGSGLATCGGPGPVLLEAQLSAHRWIAATLSPDLHFPGLAFEAGVGEEASAWSATKHPRGVPRWARGTTPMEVLEVREAQAREAVLSALVPFVDDFGRVHRVRFEVAALAAPAAHQTIGMTMDDRGHGLPLLLTELALNRPETHSDILHDLSRIVPAAMGLRYPRVQIVPKPQMNMGGAVGHGLQIQFVTGALVDAAHLSEGTLFSLGLLARIHATDGPSVILLDDLDRGLHPKAQADLCACIRRLLEVRPDLQIIATSHSPYILDHFEIEEVRVMGFGPDGLARVRPLGDHPDAERMKGLLRTGEFWSTVGEDWVGADAT